MIVQPHHAKVKSFVCTNRNTTIKLHDSDQFTNKVLIIELLDFLKK